jgi:ABC-type Co2+ transport system permease subunit
MIIQDIALVTQCVMFTHGGSMTPSTETVSTPSIPASIPASLRGRLADLDARARALPIAARARARAMITRLRIALDLPSRTEIAELTSRLEELDRRFVQLAAHAAPARASLSAPEAAPTISAPVVEVAAAPVEEIAEEAAAADDAADDAGPDATAVESPGARVSRKERRRQQASKTARR